MSCTPLGACYLGTRHGVPTRMAQPERYPAGPIAFPVTPWGPGLELDEGALRAHAARLLDSGIEALTFCGSNGEFHALGSDEYRRICEVAGDVARGRAYLIFGVGRSWRAARRQARMARRAGADAIMCIAPFTGDMNEPGLAAYYAAVAEEAGISVILYQTKWSGTLSLRLLERLAPVDNIRMVKDENGDLSHYLAVRRAFGDRFRWINGMAEPFVPSYWQLGVETFTSGLACFMPEVALRVQSLARRGDFGAVNATLDELVLPMYELRNRRPGYKVSMIKAAMALAGMPVGGVRPPLVPMRAADHRDLEGLMARHGLLAG